MEKRHVRPDALVELEFLAEPSVGTHFHGDIELLYVIDGRVKVSIDEKRYQLSSGDVIVVNANCHHSYLGGDGLFMGRFLISYRKLREMLQRDSILFLCNSSLDTLDDGEPFGELRMIISRIFNDSLNKDSSMIYRNSLYYQMLHVLSRYFLLPEGGWNYENKNTENNDRLQDIFAYIRSNYSSNIRLQDLSEHLYLSETYVSKYIKKKCGINFVELVNTVRLEYAMDDMVHSDIPLIKIAMDNGFASVIAFNRYFKNAFGETPSDYRKRIQEKSASGKMQVEKEAEEERIRQKVDAYLQEDTSWQESPCSAEKKIEADMGRVLFAFDRQSCLGMINVGTMLSLLDSGIQEQILSSAKRLGFRYIRFWNAFGAGTNIDIHAPVERQNFGRIDAAIDFLVKNELKPYFELGTKPVKLLKNTLEAVMEEKDGGQQFLSDGEMHDFYDGCMRHFIRRYGSEEVKTWYFEFHEQEELQFTDLKFHYAPMTENGHEEYFNHFDILAKTFRDILPSVRIGGGGFPLQHYGKENFTALLRRWMAHPQHPSFLSLTSYPYQLEKEGGTYYEKRVMDDDFIFHNICQAKKIMEEIAFPAEKLHISEYNITLSSRNAINDSCYKGAFLLRNMISCMKESEIFLGHWMLSDLYADYQDTYAILFGGSGILTKHGIPKPGWYAFDFLNACYPDVIAHHPNCLITRSRMNSLGIVCHNLKKMNYHYYAAEEDMVTANDISRMLEDRETLTLHIRIKNEKDGTFLVKKRRVNQDYGSIQEAWRGLNMEPELTMQEISHLKKSSTYNLTMWEMAAANGILDFKVELKPNEIAYLSITSK